MHEVLPETRSDLVALRVSGKLDETDYEMILPMLETRIEHHGKIRLYWEMEDLKGWTVEGFGKDVGFDVRHAGDFTRIAMVGEKRWEEWMTKLMKPFTTAEVRYFSAEDRLAAQTWVQGDE